MKTIVPFFAGALLLSGCDSPLEEDFDVCTPNYVMGLNVDVVDSVTTAPPASALLIARSGAFVDSVGPLPSYQAWENGPFVLRLSAAGERAGTYDLTVRSPGYRDWTLMGVKVTADGCHVRPVAVTARLRR